MNNLDLFISKIGFFLNEQFFEKTKKLFVKTNVFEQKKFEQKLFCSKIFCLKIFEQNFFVQKFFV